MDLTDDNKKEPKIISKLIPDSEQAKGTGETKEKPLKILIKEAMREELRMHNRAIKELNMRTSSLISGYLMALGHEGHNCTIDTNFEFLTLIKKENKDGKEGN